MADVSTMTLPNGDVVNIKDSAGREAATTGLSGKVDKAQGVQNQGKILKVGSSGVLELVEDSVGTGDVVGPSSSTDDHVATFDGTTGKLIQDSGFTIGKSVPADAVFTDTTYDSLEPEAGGTDESLVTTGEKATWNAKADMSDIPDVSGFYTKPSTGIPASDLASGVIPDISGKADLDENGKVPSSQLPSYVDDVLEYASLSNFPLTGESGKIYIAQDTNKTYRWSGSAYAEISESLALGETSSTAYRGDRGAEAYAAAVTNVDSTPTANSSHLVTSGGVAAAIPDVSGFYTKPATGIPATDLESGVIPDISGKVDIAQGSGNAGKILGINESGNVEPMANSGGSDMTGATASAAGTHGLVPAPAAGEQNKVLSGGGTWEYMSVASEEFILDDVSNLGGSYSHTTTLTGVTADMKPFKIELSNPTIFNDEISVTCSNGSIMLACNDVSGTSTVKVTVLKMVNGDGQTVTSHEYQVLDAAKVDKVTGKGLSSNDYTDTEKNKLSGIAEGATAVSVVDNLNSDSTTSALSAAQGKALNSKIQNKLVKIYTGSLTFSSGKCEVIIPDIVNENVYGALSVYGYGSAHIYAFNVRNGNSASYRIEIICLDNASLDGEFSVAISYLGN